MIKLPNLTFFLIAAVLGFGVPRAEPKSFAVPLSNVDGEFFYTASIGKPGQSLKIMFDTESSDVWIPSSDCSNCDSSHTLFNSKNSSTFKKTGSKKVTTTDRNGTTAWDTVVVSGLNVTSQGFVLFTSQSADSNGLTSDGTIGLGFRASSKSKLPTFIENARSQNKISKKVFALWIGNLDGTGTTSDGELRIGDYVTSRYSGSVVWVNLSSSTSWQVKMNSLTMKLSTGKVVTACKACQAVVNSGSAYITGPPSQVGPFVKTINATLGSNGFYSISCNSMSSLPDLVFKIDDKTFTIAKNIYSYKSKKNGNCYILIYADSSANKWTLGTPFLYRYYTVFDMDKNRIGFAVSKV